MGHDYEMSDYNRSDLIFTKEMLLAEPLDRTPLRTVGRVGFRRRAWREVFFFLAAIGAIAGAVGTVSLRNPFYAVLALVCHLLSLAALFLLLRAEFVAAAQVLVYAGAVMVLYVFVVAYVGGQDAAAVGRQRRRPARRLGAVRGRAVRRAVHRGPRLGPDRARHRGRRWRRHRRGGRRRLRHRRRRSAGCS